MATKDAPVALARELLLRTQVEFRGAAPLARVTQLAASMTASGFRTALVAHGYRRGSLSRALAAVFVDGRWFYADPRPGLELGQITPFVEEKFFAVPNLPVPVSGTATALVRVEPAPMPKWVGYAAVGALVISTAALAYVIATRPPPESQHEEPPRRKRKFYKKRRRR